MIKDYRKTIVLIVFILVITNFNLAFAYTPKDVESASDYAKESIVLLATKNIISGDENGNYNPKKRVSRGELVIMIVRALDIDTNNIPSVQTFKDVPKNHWAFKYVEAAYREGIIKGITTDHFDVSSKCTREEMAAIIMRSLRLKGDSIEGNQKTTHINRFVDKEKISSWAKVYIELAVYTKLMKGTSSSTFTPKGTATREQVAVIIDRILSNKTELGIFADKLEDEYKIKEGVEIVFNGDAMTFEHNLLIENNIVLAPLELFDKYIVETYYSSYFERNDEVYMETPISYHKSGIYNIRLRPGINRAYMNMRFNPFENEEQHKEQEIQLEMAPKSQDGMVFLPLKDLCNLLEIEYFYDEWENKIYLKDDRINSHPNLFYAVRKRANFPYTGNAKITGKMIERETDDGYHLQIDYQILSEINKTDSHQQVSYKIKEINKVERNIEYEEFIAKDKLYLKDFKDNKWKELEKGFVRSKRHELFHDILPESTAQEGYEKYNRSKKALDNILIDELHESHEAYKIVVSRNFDRNYGNLPIKKDGFVDINGSPTVKYSIQLDAEGMKAIIPKAVYDKKKDSFDKMFKGRVRYNIELYLKDEEIVKEVFRFYGEASDEEDTNNIDISIEIEADFKNIGSEIKITPHDEALRKQ